HPGLGQELLRRVYVLLEELLDLGLRQVCVSAGHADARPKPPLATVDRIDDRLLVDRLEDGLPDADIVVRRLRGVLVDEDAAAGALEGYPDDIRIGLYHRLDILRREA